MKATIVLTLGAIFFGPDLGFADASVSSEYQTSDSEAPANLESLSAGLDEECEKKGGKFHSSCKCGDKILNHQIYQCMASTVIVPRYIASIHKAPIETFPEPRQYQRDPYIYEPKVAYVVKLKGEQPPFCYIQKIDQKMNRLVDQKTAPKLPPAPWICEYDEATQSCQSFTDCSQLIAEETVKPQGNIAHLIPIIQSYIKDGVPPYMDQE